MKPIILISTALLALTLISACASFVAEPSHTPMLTNMSTQSSEKTLIPTIQLTVTSTPTFQGFHSHATKTPVNPKQTPTTVPHEVRRAYYDLLDNNEGCELPCWWGIEPGLTTWPDVVDRFVSLDFAIIDGLDEPRPNIVGDQKFYWLWFQNAPAGFTDNKDRRRTLYRQGFFVDPESLIVTRIWAVSSFTIRHYSVSSMMAKMGKPEEIVLGFRLDTGGNLGYDLFMYYPDFGTLLIFENVFLWFDTDIGYSDLETLELCIDYGPEFILWPSNEESEIYQMVEFGFPWVGVEKSKYLSIEEASGLSIEDFYDKFINADVPPCMEINLGAFLDIGF